MNTELETQKLLAVLRRSVKKGFQNFVALKQIMKLLRQVDTGTACAKICIRSLGVFTSILENSNDTNDARFVCIAILCLREMCRSRVDDLPEGIRLALATNNFIQYALDVILSSTYRPLHSCVILFLLELCQEPLLLSTFECKEWLSLPECILSLMSNAQLECKRTAMNILTCLLSDETKKSRLLLCPSQEAPWIKSLLPHLYRLLLSFGNSSSQFEAAECLVLYYSVFECPDILVAASAAVDNSKCNSKSREGPLGVAKVVRLLLQAALDENLHPFITKNSWFVGGVDHYDGTSTPASPFPEFLSLDVTSIESNSALRIACHLTTRIIEDTLHFTRRSSRSGTDIGNSNEWREQVDRVIETRLRPLRDAGILEGLIRAAVTLSDELGYGEGGPSIRSLLGSWGSFKTEEAKKSLSLLYDTMQLWVSVDKECAWQMSLLLCSAGVIADTATYDDNNSIFNDAVRALSTLLRAQKDLLVRSIDLREANAQSANRSIVPFKQALEKAKKNETPSSSFSDSHGYVNGNADTAFVQDTGVGIQQQHQHHQQENVGAYYHRKGAEKEGSFGYKAFIELFKRHGYPTTDIFYKKEGTKRPSQLNDYERRLSNIHHRENNSDDGSATVESIEMTPASESEMIQALRDIGRIPNTEGHHSGRRSRNHSHGRRSNKSPPGVGSGALSTADKSLSPYPTGAYYNTLMSSPVAADESILTFNTAESQRLLSAKSPGATTAAHAFTLNHRDYTLHSSGLKQPFDDQLPRYAIRTQDLDKVLEVCESDTVDPVLSSPSKTPSPPPNSSRPSRGAISASPGRSLRMTRAIPPSREPGNSTHSFKVAGEVRESSLGVGTAQVLLALAKGPFGFQEDIHGENDSFAYIPLEEGPHAYAKTIPPQSTVDTTQASLVKGAGRPRKSDKSDKNSLFKALGPPGSIKIVKKRDKQLL
jgi:hypothetical protein